MTEPLLSQEEIVATGMRALVVLARRDGGTLTLSAEEMSHSFSGDLWVRFDDDGACVITLVPARRQ